MSHQVFICAAPNDETVAAATCSALEAEGMACWTASRDLPPGADPVETAKAAIAAAQVMVLIFSAKANDAAEQIKRELQFAALSQTPLLPFRVENVRPVATLEYFLPANQFVDAVAPPLQTHLRRLAAMLKPVLEKAAPRPPMPAPVVQTVPEPQVPVAPEPEPPVAQQPQAAPEPPAPVVETPPGPEPEPAPSAVPDEPAPEIAAPVMAASPPQQPPSSAEEPSSSRKLLLLALIAVVVIVLAGGAWWLLKPGASAQEQKAWTSATAQDAIPGYQTYLGAWPKGFYRDQATARVASLSSQAQDAFAKAKAANTAAAYEGFLASYAKQGVDVKEARDADTAILAEEAKAKTAFDTATTAHSRDGYKSFLADFGASSFAADARKRLAACHTETRNTTTVKNTPLSESGSGTGTSSDEACAAARDHATSQAQASCKEGHMGAVRVTSQTPQSDGRQGGRILGSIFDTKSDWKCTEQISASCEVSTSGVHQVDICP